MQIFTTNSISTLRRTLTSTAKNLKHLPASVKTIAQRAIATKSIVGHKGARYRALMVFIVLFGFTISVFGQADFTVTPSARTATVGEVFNLTVVITTSEAANAGEVHMTFDETILQVNSISTTGPFNNLLFAPSFDNINGTIDYAAGIPTFGQDPVEGIFDFLIIEVQAIGNGTGVLDFNGEDPSKITSGINPGTVILDSATGSEITVGSVNQPPVFVNNLTNQTNNEQDIVVALDASATDPDGNSISYEATNLPAGLSIDANGFISGTIDLGASNGGSLNTGVYAVVITATDDGTSPLSVSQNFQWTVTTPTVPTYTITASAGDNGSIDPLTATVNEGSDQTFNFTPDAGFEVSEVLVNGIPVSPVPTTSYTITNVISATNISVSFSEITTGPFQLCIASGSGDLTAFGRSFVGDPGNPPPTGLGFTRTGGLLFAGYNEVIADAAAGDETTLYQKEIYGGKTVGGGQNPPFTYEIPVANGTYQVDLYFAEVFHPSSGGRIFDVFLENNLMLDEYDLVDPIKDGISTNQTAIVRTYNVAVTDGILSLQIGPASVDNGKLSGICVTEAPGANLHPVTAIGDLTYDALVAVADPLTIVDPENDELSIVFNGLPASLSYDPTTNQIQGTPLATDANTYTINAIISDGTNSPVTEEFTLVINPAAGNDAPTIDAIADVEVNEGELLSQVIMVTDDNLPVTTIELFDVSAGGTNNPFNPTTSVAVGTLDDNTGGSYTFNWTPAAGTGRSYLARVTADDGVNAPVTEEFGINVAQQLPGTILARTFTNPVPWYGSSTPDASNGYSVAIETSPAKNIGYIDNGDFVEYLINVPTAGIYDLEVFAGKGSPGTTAVTFLEENSTDFVPIGAINVIQTGWQNYASYKTQVTFTNAGVQTFRFDFNGGANIRDFNFKNTTSNNPPVVTISTPIDGIALTMGTSLDFIGSVEDVEDDDATLTAALSWSSNLDGPLGTGGNISSALTTVGTHTITAEVIDLDATTPLAGTATITLVVTETDPSCDARFRVNAGGPLLIASSGDFEEDQKASGPTNGTAQLGTPSPYLDLTAPAEDTTFGSNAPLVSNDTGYPDYLFQTERYSQVANPDNMNWTFPTGNGVYEVKMLFNENWTNEISNPRVFDVEIEGVIALENYRPSGDLGADVNVAKVETFQATVTDGELNINFIQGTQNPSIKGFDICFVSDLPGTLPPVFTVEIPDQNNIEGDTPTGLAVAANDPDGGIVTFSDNGTLPPGLSIDPNTGAISGTISAGAATSSPYSVIITATDDEPETKTSTFTWTVVGPVSLPLCINSGNQGAITAFGKPFIADQYVTPADGNFYNTPTGQAIAGTTPGSGEEDLFQSEHWTNVAGGLQYNIPTGNGDFTIELYMAELFANASNARLLNITIEGVEVLTGLDLFATYGKFTAATLPFSTTVTDGFLDIVIFTNPGDDNPKLNGLCVSVTSPNTPPTVTISSPTDNLTPISIDRLDSTTFTASVEDAEDDNTTLNNALVWSIDPIEPNFAGTGGTFDETLFVPGVYTIRATTTDSDTNVAFDEIQVTVLGPDVNFTAPEENADVATTDVQVTWSATNMNYGGTTPEHFHLWVNPADPNNLVAEDRISTASFPGQLFWDLTAEDGIVEGPNKVIIIAADNGHLEFLNAEARDEVNFTVLGDTTNPIAVCQDITVELDATGSVSIAAADVDGGSSDTEGIASLAIDVETFTGADLGANTVTLTVTDTNNNTATCTATVTVVDNLAPVAVCQDITVQLDASGNGSITAAAIDGGSSDNVSIDDLTVDISDFNVNNVGANTVTLTVTDASGNSATCAATVTVEDNVAPTAICQNIEVALDANGIANITAAEIDNGSNDASGIASLSVSPSTFDCANIVGENTVTLTVTDNNGKTATCTAIVTVIDDTPPVLVDCPGNRLITSPTAQILELTPPTATDACGVNTVIGTRSDDLALTDPYQVGTVTTVTWMATDNNGVVGTCQTIVTITAPVSSGKEITGFDVAGQVGDESINSGAGTIALTVSTGTPVTALAPTIAISNAANISPASGAVRDFSNPQTYTVTAEDNTTKEWTVTISVSPDTEAPVVDCPQNIVVGNDPGECGAVVDFTATASDNLPGVSLEYSVASGSLFDVGTTTVMVTATDAANLTATCSFVVTVNDLIPPVAPAAPADLTLQCASDVPAPVELTAIDNCEGEITVSPQVTLTPSSLNEQVWVRTWTFTDGSGNSSSVSQTITVLDDTAPVVSCPGDQTELGDINGDFVIPDYTGLAIAIDNCDGETEVTQDPLPGTLISGTTTVTITSVDITENSGSCTFNVTVIPETLASLTIAPSTIAENLLQGETTTVNYVVESDDASTLPTPAAMAIIDNATNEVATWATTTSAANQGTSYEVNLNATGLTPGTYTAILTAGPVTGYTNASIPITLIVEPPLSNAALIVLDATTDTPLFALTNGLQISKATIGNTPLGVIFNTSLNPGGVQFTLTGPITESRTEGPAPHSLFGDIGVNIQGKPFPVGNYTLVADPNVGPTITVNFSVTNVNPLCTNFNASISGVTNPSTCSGVGNATAVPSGGASPFTYQWDNGEITATANNLSVGPHSVIVRDANGCSKTLTFNITGPSLPIVTLAPFANVLNTAAAFALTGGSPVGGTYSGPGVTGSTFNPAIGVGTYAITYTYTDSNGCANSATRNITVTTQTSNAALIVLDATTDTPLFALTNGLQISKATIGNTPLGVIFNTSLNPGGVQFTLTGPITESRTEGPAPHSLFGDIGVNIQGKPFPVGNYTLVADPNVGPTITVNFSVTNVNPLCTNFNASISGVTNPSTCSGVGNATAVPSGGASPFTYQWDNGEITATANNLSVGPHSVIVRDANGCSKTLTFNITGPSLPIVTLAPFANVLNTAAAFALTGGSPVGGTYSGPGVTSSTFNPAIGVGTYAITYTYTDSNGCANSATRNITVTTQTSNAALIVLDATTDTPLFALTNGLQISKATIGNTPLGIVYNPSLNPGGIRFVLTGPITESRTEGASAPYSLFGDIGVDVQGKVFPVGNYTLVANPNSGPTITVNFSVVNNGSTNKSTLATNTPLNEMSIAPNPASEMINMSFDEPVLIEEILIFDVTGRLIKTIREPLGLNSKSIDFNVYDLPIGTYFIKTIDSKGTQYQQQMLIDRY